MTKDDGEAPPGYLLHELAKTTHKSWDDSRKVQVRKKKKERKKKKLRNQGKKRKRKKLSQNLIIFFSGSSPKKTCYRLPKRQAQNFKNFSLYC